MIIVTRDNLVCQTLGHGLDRDRRLGIRLDTRLDIRLDIHQSTRQDTRQNTRQNTRQENSFGTLV